jgi:hypothetical protein
VQNVCIIHDRHKGILQAINDMKRAAQSDTELHYSQMSRAGGVLGT